MSKKRAPQVKYAIPKMQPGKDYKVYHITPRRQCECCKEKAPYLIKTKSGESHLFCEPHYIDWKRT